MAFKNRIRLPFYLTEPQFPIERTGFRFANGVAKTISAVVRKTYIGKGDMMSERMLEKLAILLVHDDITIEGMRYLGGVALDSEFSIAYQDFMDFPLGIPTFTVQATPYFETNSNCQTCEEAVQLNLEDDEFYGDLGEGEEDSINVFGNDVICCNPVTASITSFSSAYLTSMTIDNDGNLTVVVKNPAPSGTNVKLGTYRVTCPNGSYDEADIYGTIDGSEPACEPISGLNVTDMDGDAGTAVVNFTPSPSSPGDGYDWYLVIGGDLAHPVQAGNSASSPINLTGLIPGQEYEIIVIAVCAQDVFYSEAVFTNFTMPGTEDNCLFFSVVNADYPDEPLARYTYMDCNGNLQNGLVRGVPDVVCMLSTDGVTPVYFTSNGPGLAQAIASGPCT